MYKQKTIDVKLLKKIEFAYCQFYNYAFLGIYVKVQMNHARRPYKSKKTVIKNTADDPIFNESFSFCIAGQPVEACNFVITMMVCPKKHLSQNEIYGKVDVGSFMFARGDKLVHWQEMMSQPRTTITKWHTLSNDMSL